MNIYVIIVTYKGHHWYRRCFDSLRDSTVPIKIIVVDNASNDGTIEFIHENYPEIIVFELKENLGFGKANNLGIKYAFKNNADYIFLLNQDTWIRSNTISGLIDIHYKRGEFGILSPIHINAQQNGIELGLLEYIANYKITNPSLISDLYFDQLKDFYETNYVNAAAWLLPRKTIEEIGGFDPIFFHYGEDDNYMQRVIYHGFKICICPKLQIVHDTEIRVNQLKDAEQTNLKVILTQLTDINVKFSFNKFLFLFLRKIFHAICSFNLNKFRVNIMKLRYLVKMRSEIIESRRVNSFRGLNWL